MAPPITILATQGAPFGLGPEVILPSMKAWNCPSHFRLFVLGFPEHFAPYASDGIRIPEFICPEDLKAAATHPGIFFGRLEPEDLNRPIIPGQPCQLGARAALRSIEAAISLVMRNEADAL